MDLIYRLIKLNRFIKSYRIKFLMILICDLLEIRHLFLRFDPVNACNLRCGMCYWSGKGYGKKVRGRFDKDDIDRIGKLFFPRALQLVIGCSSEPTLYKRYGDIIKLGRSYNVPFIGLTTNGQLLTEEAIEQLVVNQLDEITVSVHGVYKTSYEKFMVNASYDRLIESLRLLKKVKLKHSSVKPHLRINYTTNEDNMLELREFFDVYREYGIHTLQIRPMADVGQTAYVYKNFGQKTRQTYDQLIEILEKQCQKEGVVLLATKQDPNFEKEDKGTSYALPAVLRSIHPNKVWAVDFDWKQESYRDYCKRIGWRWLLFKSVVAKKELFKKSKLYLKYDVTM